MSGARVLGCALAGAMIAACAAPLGAQQWRTVDVARQLRDTAPHDVRISYGAGSVSVRAADEPVLFAMHLRYDEDAVTPVHRYDAANRRLTLGLGDASVRIGRSMGKDSYGELRVRLGRAVPMNLDLALGAAEARLDLGGLALRGLRVETGASDSKLTFDAPNRVRMDRLEVSAGAASLAVSGLANANAGSIHVTSGVGNVELSFDGALTGDVRIESEMALGRIEITLPRGAGVRVELSRFIAGFDHFGLQKRGDAWYSDDWDRATHRATLKIRTAFGGVVVRRAP